LWPVVGGGGIPQKYLHGWGETWDMRASHDFYSIFLMKKWVPLTCCMFNFLKAEFGEGA